MFFNLFQVQTLKCPKIIFLVLGLFLFLSCNEVELASKIHANNTSAKWTRIYNDYRTLEEEVQEADFIITQGVKIINKKAGGQLDSTQSGSFAYSRSQYLSLKPKVENLHKNCKAFHRKYMKDRDLFNRWLDNVNGDYISQEVYLKEAKIMENKMQDNQKELQKLVKSYQELKEQNQLYSQKIFEIAPELVGIIIL